METQRTISDWAVETFGYPKTPEHIIKRMLQECEELKKLVESNSFSYEMIADEISDIFIVGYQAMDTMGYNTQSCVDHKMQINRARKWKLNNDGTAQHIKE